MNSVLTHTDDIEILMYAIKTIEIELTKFPMFIPKINIFFFQIYLEVKSFCKYLNY